MFNGLLHLSDAVSSGLYLTNPHNYLKNKEEEIVTIVLVLETESQKVCS